jgi:hypothetical protein
MLRIQHLPQALSQTHSISPRHTHVGVNISCRETASLFTEEFHFCRNCQQSSQSLLLFNNLDRTLKNEKLHPDQMPVYSDLPSNYTVIGVMENSVMIRTNGIEKIPVKFIFEVL